MKKFLFPAMMSIVCLAATGSEVLLVSENFDGKVPVRWEIGRGECGVSVSSAELVPKAGSEESAALVWRYDFSKDEPAGGTYVRLRPLLEIPGKPVRFTVRIKGDKSGLGLVYRLRDASDRVWQFGLGPIDFEGWKTFDVTVKPGGFAWGGTVRPDKGFTYPLKFEEFLLDYSRPAEKKSGQLVLDGLTIYGETIEREEF